MALHLSGKDKTMTVWPRTAIVLHYCGDDDVAYFGGPRLAMPPVLFYGVGGEVNGLPVYTVLAGLTDVCIIGGDETVCAVVQQ